ncbi:MAG: hypothetical protein AB1420_03485 [Bacillota bacterium]
MATEIHMPQLGLTMTEGKITKWFKQAVRLITSLNRPVTVFY